MTEKTLDWLNGNRFRAYPFVNDGGLLMNGKRIPNCVLLDCLVFDTRDLGHIPELIFTEIDVTEEKTEVSFAYDGNDFSFTLKSQEEFENEVYGTESFVVLKDPCGLPSDKVYLRLTASSHAYILKEAGTGNWKFHGKILPTKVISGRVSGVSSISVNGSLGEGVGGQARGLITLKDGYRTMPTIRNGRIVVNVGRKFGEDPCHHVFEDVGRTVCSDQMLFFCGQTADARGNVVLQGGKGVSVTQGRTYVASEDILDSKGEIGIRMGEEIPCIEVSASSELMKIYTPAQDSSSDSSGSDD